MSLPTIEDEFCFCAIMTNQPVNHRPKLNRESFTLASFPLRDPQFTFINKTPLPLSKKTGQGQFDQQ